MAKAKRTRAVRKKKRVTADTTSIDELVGYVPDGETLDISSNFLDYTFLLYGESGSGKTSTLSKAPGAYHIQCDPRRKNLQIRQTNIPDTSLKVLRKSSDFTPWDIIEATLEKCIEDDSVNTVVIDNMRIFYDHASNHYCNKNRVDSLSEMDDYGVSWNNVDAMFCDWFTRICNAGKGLGFVTHQKEVVIELPGDKTKTLIQPDVTGRMYQTIRALTDFAFYLGFDDQGQRVVTIRDDGNNIWYKCCTDEDDPHFFSPEGIPVHRISAGNSPGECWENLMKSWNNELHDVDYVAPLMRKKGTSKRRKTPRK